MSDLQEVEDSARDGQEVTAATESPAGPIPTPAALEFQSLILSQVSDAVISITNSGVVTYLNPAAERQYRTTAEHAIGRPLSELYTYRWIRPGDEPAAMAALARDGYWRGENLHVRHDGVVLHVESSVSVLHDSAGAACGLLAVVRDVTEQKQAEQALREADRRKDEFLAILAHELRNPLAPIRTAVGILRTAGVPEAISARSREVIERQVAHMTRLIDDLLDVSRLSRGKMNLQLGPLLLDQVLDAAVETARPSIQERGHVLEQARAAAAVSLEGDLARLSQVFANLLNNAAKFTPPGGVIHLDVTETPGTVEVRVTDNGPGIAPEHVDAIFDLFTQAPHAPSSAAGLGIGLTLARRLVELHGGSLTVGSPGPGRGATFIVTLPAARSSDPGAGRPDPQRGPERNLGRRVLVVDDNVDAAQTTAALLEAAGCQVRTAYSGEQALAELAEFPAEIVLLDLGMPGLSGVDTCVRIRRTLGGAALFIAAVTGWGQEEDRRRTASAGFDAHLVKPVAPDELLHLVERARDD